MRCLSIIEQASVPKREASAATSLWLHLLLPPTDPTDPTDCHACAAQGLGSIWSTPAGRRASRQSACPESTGQSWIPRTCVKTNKTRAREMAACERRLLTSLET